MKINIVVTLLCTALTCVSIIIPISKTIQVSEIRNESTNAHKLIYKNDTSSTIHIKNQIHDPKIADNDIAKDISKESLADKETFYIAPLSTYLFDGMTIPMQKLNNTDLPQDEESKQLFQKLFSDTFIRIEQIRPEGWVGGSHYIIFINPTTKKITLSKQSGSIYYKNWDAPITYTFATDIASNKISSVRIIINHDNQVSLEEIK